METNLVTPRRHTMQKKALSGGSNLTPSSPHPPSPRWSSISMLLPISPPSNFFFFIRFSFQAALPLKPLVPIIHRGFSLMHHSWFCSLMHSISLFSLPSQPHHQIFIIGFYVVLQPQPPPPLVLSWFLLLLSTFYPILILSSGLLLPTSSFSAFFYAPTLLYPSHSLFHYYHFSPSILSPFSPSSALPRFPPRRDHPIFPPLSLSLSFSICASLRWLTES